MKRVCCGLGLSIFSYVPFLDEHINLELYLCWNVLKFPQQFYNQFQVQLPVLRKYVLKNGKKVRSSSMFIKENQKIIGMLCINFDDSKFHDINCQILRIIHPDMFVKNYLSDVSYNILVDENKNKSNEENSTDNIENFMEKI